MRAVMRGRCEDSATIRRWIPAGNELSEMYKAAAVSLFLSLSLSLSLSIQSETRGNALPRRLVLATRRPRVS